MIFELGYIPSRQKLFVYNSDGFIFSFRKDNWTFRHVNVLDFFCKEIIKNNLYFTRMHISDLSEYYNTTKIRIKDTKLRIDKIEKFKRGLKTRIRKWDFRYSIISELER